MSHPLQLPACTSCNRDIIPNDQRVNYHGPKCGYVLIWRCESCLEFAINHKGVGGFEGPYT